MAKLPFGNYKGISLEFINTGYLKWLTEEADWFADKFPGEFNAVEDELNRRDYENDHFYEDKVIV